jgi:hypothetical protein
MTSSLIMEASASDAAILSLFQRRESRGNSAGNLERTVLAEICPEARDRLTAALQFGTAWNSFIAFSSVL